MEQIGFSQQNFLVYRHEDSGHSHVHIITTNIQRTGERIDIHGIGYRLCEPARKALEEKYGLISAQGKFQQVLKGNGGKSLSPAHAFLKLPISGSTFNI